MNEIDFKAQLAKWQIRVRDAIVPTTTSIVLFGHKAKTKIITKEHEHLVYSCLRPLESPTDEVYKDLTERLKYNDAEVLKFIQEPYEQYLKSVKRQITVLQKEWSRNYCQFRAMQVMNVLEYDNIIAICDMSDNRLVPIELVLKTVFGISSEYGEHRRVKDKTEVYIDPRVLARYNAIKEDRSRTTVHGKRH